jgi:two-component system chemotaxis response regulator CheY
MRAILKDMLTRLGHRDVEEADSGAAAMKKISAKRYALIISDWHMEPMNGPALLQSIEKLRTKDSYRFIFATAAKSWSTQAEARMNGADAFIVKPFTIAELKAKIEGVLGRS